MLVFCGCSPHPARWISTTQVLRRVDASLAALLEGAAAAESRCVAAVSHSAFLRVVLATILDVSLAEATLALKFGNAGVTVVDVDAGYVDVLGQGGGLVAIGDPRTKRQDMAVPAATRTHYRTLRINETRHLQGLVADA
jgi:broad specificity phosphatase PhoE